jgi:hypothetical protein
MAAQPEIDVVTTADWEWNYYHKRQIETLAARLRDKKSQAQPQPQGDAAKVARTYT